MLRDESTLKRGLYSECEQEVQTVVMMETSESKLLTSVSEAGEEGELVQTTLFSTRTVELFLREGVKSGVNSPRLYST